MHTNYMDAVTADDETDEVTCVPVKVEGVAIGINNYHIEMTADQAIEFGKSLIKAGKESKRIFKAEEKERLR